MKTGLLLMAHGSRQAEANADLESVAQLLRARDVCEIVVASFLELAQPDIIEGGLCCVLAGAQRVVMLPYFLAAGTHVRRDLTSARAELTELFPQVEFRLAEPLGPHPLLLEIVVDRFMEAGGLNAGDRE